MSHSMPARELSAVLLEPQCLGEGRKGTGPVRVPEKVFPQWDQKGRAELSRNSIWVRLGGACRLLRDQGHRHLLLLQCNDKRQRGGSSREKAGCRPA